MASNDLQRELWRETQRHIADYEARTRELALDVQAENKAVQTTREELAGLRKEHQNLQAAKVASDRAALDEHDKMLALSRARDSELAEERRLALQVASLLGELEEARRKAEKEGREYDSHLAETQAHLQKLLSYYNQADAVTTTATAISDIQITVEEPGANDPQVSYHDPYTAVTYEDGGTTIDEHAQPGVYQEGLEHDVNGIVMQVGE